MKQSGPGAKHTAESLVGFVQALEGMKTHTRTAWASDGRRESIAEHSWRVAMLALAAAPHLPELDGSRLVEICLVHDLGEVLEGDVSAPLQSSSTAKEDVERAAVSDVTRALEEPARSRVRTLWEEYERAKTAEARVARALDKMETIIQHNQGANPRDFDYRFNLSYGADLELDAELLRELRAIVDRDTARRADEG